MATVLQRPALEPTTQQFIDSLAAAGGPPVYTLSPSAAREVSTSLQAAPVEKAPASIEDTDFPVGPTGTVRIRIVHATPSQSGRPTRRRNTSWSTARS